MLPMRQGVVFKLAMLNLQGKEASSAGVSKQSPTCPSEGLCSSAADLLHQPLATTTFSFRSFSVILLRPDIRKIFSAYGHILGMFLSELTDTAYFGQNCDS